MDTVKLESIQKEGSALLFGFRLLSEDEQRIAYAVLEGMRLQKQLDSKKANVSRKCASDRAGQRTPASGE